jgi:hypothetical protein
MYLVPLAARRSTPRCRKGTDGAAGALERQAEAIGFTVACGRSVTEHQEELRSVSRRQLAVAKVMRAEAQRMAESAGVMVAHATAPRAIVARHRAVVAIPYRGPSDQGRSASDK